MVQLGHLKSEESSAISKNLIPIDTFTTLLSDSYSRAASWNWKIAAAMLYWKSTLWKPT